MQGLLWVVLCFFGTCLAQTEYGYCRLLGNSVNPTVVGSVYFVSDGTNVTVIANITGIVQPGIPHGMHVHEFGDLTSSVSDSVGSHYKGPGTGVHGCPPNGTRDAGDMGNWNVTTGGVLIGTKTLDLLSLSNGFSVIGRAVVLHLLTDDCVTVASASSRVAHGVIGVGNKAYFPNYLGTITANTASNPGATAGTRAVCTLSGTTGNIVTGSLVFDQAADGAVTVTGSIVGLHFNTTHGMHLHEFGDLTSGDGLSLGSHYNPSNYSHNLPPNSTRHYGDMGNICTFSPDGTAYYSFSNNTLLAVNSSINNIIGRGVVIHAIRDYGYNQTAYGDRVATCAVGIANPKYSSLITFDDNCCSDPSCVTPDLIQYGYSTTTTSTTSATTTGTTSGIPATTSGGDITSSIPVSSTSGSPASDNNTSTPKATVIVVSILVPLVAINLILIAVFFYLRKKKNKAQNDKFTPFLDSNNNDY